MERSFCRLLFCLNGLVLLSLLLNTSAFGAASKVLATEAVKPSARFKALSHKNNQGDTQLHLKCKNGDLASTRRLLKGLSSQECRALIVQEGVLNRTALHHAAQSGNNELFAYLLSCLGDAVSQAQAITLQNTASMTPFQCAAQRGCCDMVTTMLAVVTPRQIVDSCVSKYLGTLVGNRPQKSTLLSDVVGNGDLAMVHTIMSAFGQEQDGAQLFHDVKIARAFLTAAARAPNQQIVDLLVQLIPPKVAQKILAKRTTSGGTLLHDAVEKKNLMFVAKMLQNFDAAGRAELALLEDHLGHNLLWAAVRVCSAEQVKALLQLFDQQTLQMLLGYKSYKRPYGLGEDNILHILAEYATQDMLTLFLPYLDAAWPALLADQNAQGNTPLHTAAGHNNLPFISEVCDWNTKEEVEALLFTKNQFGLTPFFKAVKAGKEGPCVQFLQYLEREKAVKLVNMSCGDGSNALHFAVQTANPELVSKLKLFLTPAEFKKLLVTQDTKTKSSPLHAAVKAKTSDKMVPHLLALLSAQDKAALLHLLDSSGDTALHIAIKNGQEQTALHLVSSLEPGARETFVAAVDVKGRNAVHLAAKYSSATFFDDLFSLLPRTALSGLCMAQEVRNRTPLIFAVKRDTKIAFVQKWEEDETASDTSESDSSLSDDSMSGASEDALLAEAAQTGADLHDSSDQEESVIAQEEIEERDKEKEKEDSDELEERTDVMIVTRILSALSHEMIPDYLRMQGADGSNVLHVAAERSKKHMFKVLLAPLSTTQRYDLLTQKNTSGFTPHLALIMCEDSEAVTEVFNALPREDAVQLFESTSDEGDTFMHGVMQFNKANHLKALIDLISDEAQTFSLAQRTNIAGFNPLQAAVLMSEACVKVLLDCLTPAHFFTLAIHKNNHGVNALRIAVVTGKVGLVNLILDKLPQKDKVALVLSPDHAGASSLHYAAGQPNKTFDILARIVPSKQLADELLCNTSLGFSPMYTLVRSNQHQAVLSVYAHFDQAARERLFSHKTSHNTSLGTNSSQEPRGSSHIPSLDSKTPLEEKAGLLGVEVLDHQEKTEQLTAQLQNFNWHNPEAVENMVTQTEELELTNVATQPAGNTVLWCACAMGYATMFESLCSLCEPEKLLSYLHGTNEAGQNIMHAAAMGEDEGILRFLYKKLGHDTCKRMMLEYDRLGSTPLMYAAYKGNRAVFECTEKLLGKDFLLEHLKLTSGAGCTIFHAAAVSKSGAALLSYLSFLLKSESKGLLGYLCMRDDAKATPLHVAIVRDNKAFLENALDGLPLQERQQVIISDQLLHMAAESTKDILALALAALTDEQCAHACIIQDQDGDTPLSVAIASGRHKNVRLLQRRLASDKLFEALSMRNSEQQKGLHIAARQSPYVLDELGAALKPDALIQLLSTTNRHGETPLHCSVYVGDRSTCSRLLELLDPEIAPLVLQQTTTGGDNLLHAAARLGNYDLIRYIIDTFDAGVWSALLMAHNQNHSTPLDLALEYERVDSLEYMLRSLKGCNKFQDAVMQRDAHGRNMLYRCIMAFHSQKMKRCFIAQFDEEALKRCLSDRDAQDQQLCTILAADKYAPIRQILKEYNWEHLFESLLRRARSE